MLFLCSLPDSWDHLVMCIWSTTTTFKLEDVVGLLLSEEMKIKYSKMAKEALVARGRKTKKRKKKNKKGKSKYLGRSKSPSKKSKAKCWNCGKPGHLCKYCREEEKNKGKKDFTKFDTDKYYHFDVDSFFMALATHTSEDVQLIDSGAHFHMISHRYWFLKYEELDGGKVYMGDNSHLNIVGCCRVKIRFLDGKVKGINGVLQIHALARNLLLVNMLGDVAV